MEQLESLTADFANAVWGNPLLILLVGGGLFFAIYSRLLPYRHVPHALGIMFGRYNNPDDVGEITHAQALAAALSGTLGLGNIAGVALAIAAGGPGAVFWIWVTALVGIATCTSSDHMAPIGPFSKRYFSASCFSSLDC